MVRILRSEGFEVSERGTMRVRAKNRWLLRVPNTVKSTASDGPPQKKRRTEEGEAGQVQSLGGEEQQGEIATEGMNPEITMSLEDVIRVRQSTMLEHLLCLTHMQDHEQQAAAGDVEDDPSMQNERRRSPMPPEIEEKRRQRLSKYKAVSDELYASKKRRRRTRGFAGLPADPPAPPRFPSETTLDESKAYMHMDNDRYREARDQFQAICEEAGILKKTQAGPERWQAAKNRLIAENPHLDKQFNGAFDGVAKEHKALALDVICTDVTKRMRTIDKHMTIAEAKNILGINPAQSREVRTQFYNILIDSHFTGKLEAGDEQCKQLQQRWIDGSQVLQESLALDEEDPVYKEKMKAVDILSRDVMKRLRDDQNKNDPEGKRQINNGPGPGPAGPRFKKQQDNLEPPFSPTPPRSTKPRTTSASATPQRQRASVQPRTARPPPQVDTAPQANMNTIRQQDTAQIDPSLLAAAENNLASAENNLAAQLQQYAASTNVRPVPNPQENLPYVPAAQMTAYEPQQQQQQQQALPEHPVPASMPVWIRNAPTSTVQRADGRQAWIAMLPGASLYSVKYTALKGLVNARIDKVWGIVVTDDQETSMQLRSDAELDAYFSYIKETGAGDPILTVEILQA
jgi:hypothetical protein